MKNSLIISLCLLTITALLFTGCKRDPVDKNTIHFHCEAYAGTDELYLNKDYKLSNGEHYALSMIRFYLCDIRLVKQDNSEVLLKNYLLITPEIILGGSPNSGTEFILPDVKDGNYKSIKFGIGLNPVLNASDPNSYANNDALSTYRGTNWLGMGGYRFAMLEGKCSNPDSAKKSLTSDLQYHIGFDSLYTQLEFPLSIKLEKSSTEHVHFNLDVNKVLGAMDFRTELMTHGTAPFSKKIMTNIAAALKIE